MEQQERAGDSRQLCRWSSQQNLQPNVHNAVFALGDLLTGPSKGTLPATSFLPAICADIGTWALGPLQTCLLY